MKRIYLFLMIFSLLMSSTTLLAKSKEIHVCEKHQVPLMIDQVPILYGLPSQEELENLEHVRRNFPNANTKVEGGCEIGHKKKQKVFYCPPMPPRARVVA